VTKPTLVITRVRIYISQDSIKTPFRRDWWLWRHCSKFIRVYVYQ